VQEEGIRALYKGFAPKVRSSLTDRAWTPNNTQLTPCFAWRAALQVLRMGLGGGVGIATFEGVGMLMNKFY
jgi:hypothetical protein